MQKIKYSIILPIYNDEDNIFQWYIKIKSIMDLTEAPYELLFINDGSRDQTEECLITIRELNKKVKSLNFLSNPFVFKFKSWLGSIRKLIEFGNKEQYTEEIALISR